MTLKMTFEEVDEIIVRMDFISIVMTRKKIANLSIICTLE